jgi:hypothetical protein
MSESLVAPNYSVAATVAAPVSLSTKVYRSRAVAPLSATELHELTMAAEARNRREAITGLVLYDDNRFFQWLEGPAENVERIMRSIRNDPRHTDLEMLHDKAAQSRIFGDWNMKLAARGPDSVSWRRDVLEPSSDIVEGLREHPDAAPVLLVKLVPRSADARQGPLDRAPLSRTAASVLKDVILSVVLPGLVQKRDVPAAQAQSWPASPRMQELVDLLTAADQTAARELIAELHASEGSVWPLFPTLLEPAARSLGDLWSQDVCSEFDVTVGLCRMQTAARLLGATAERRIARGAPGPAVLIAPEPGELHQLGAALDSEVMWNAGWAPHSEFPNSDKALLDMLSGTWFDALDVSLSSAFRREHWLPRLTRTIAEARRASRNPALVVLVGGRIFVEQQTARAAVGADVASTTALDVDHLILDSMAKRDAKAPAR